MMRKSMYALSIFLTMFLVMGAAYAHAAAPTTGSIDAPSTVQTNIVFSVKLSGLATTAGSNYYVVYVDSTTYGLSNITVVATSSTMYVRMKFTSEGSNTISLGGSTTVGGSAASAIDSVYVTAEDIGTGLFDTDAFTNLLPFLIPIAIVAGLAVTFKWKKNGKSL